MPKDSFKHQQSLQIPRSIIFMGKLLQIFSTDWATRFAQKLFVTPIKFKTPKREIEMLKKSVIQPHFVAEIKKEITTYTYGEGAKKALLIHGWNGRGTQMVTLANALLKQGYTCYSFDAPGHGSSRKTTSNMTEFIASALYMQEKFGPFDVVIGHSLGGMSTLNAMTRGLTPNKAILIGSGDVVEDIIDDFVRQLELKPIVAKKMKHRFEDQFQQTMASYCVHLAAKSIHVPVFVIHDEHDLDVPVSAAHSIHQNLEFGSLLITKKLGHRKILGTKEVIQAIVQFVN